MAQDCVPAKWSSVWIKLLPTPVCFHCSPEKCSFSNGTAMYTGFTGVCFMKEQAYNLELSSRTKCHIIESISNCWNRCLRTAVSEQLWYGKWTCISIALFQSTDHSKSFTPLVRFTYSRTVVHTLMIGAAMQGASCQKQFGVQYRAQGHFHMQPGELAFETKDLPIMRSPALPPKLQPPDI